MTRWPDLGPPPMGDAHALGRPAVRALAGRPRCPPGAGPRGARAGPLRRPCVPRRRAVPDGGRRAARLAGATDRGRLPGAERADVRAAQGSRRRLVPEPGRRQPRRGRGRPGVVPPAVLRGVDVGRAGARGRGSTDRSGSTDAARRPASRRATEPPGPSSPPRRARSRRSSPIGSGCSRSTRRAACCGRRSDTGRGHSNRPPRASGATRWPRATASRSPTNRRTCASRPASTSAPGGPDRPSGASRPIRSGGARAVLEPGHELGQLRGDVDRACAQAVASSSKTPSRSSWHIRTMTRAASGRPPSGPCAGRAVELGPECRGLGVVDRDVGRATAAGPTPASSSPTTDSAVRPRR